MKYKLLAAASFSILCLYPQALRAEVRGYIIDAATSTLTSGGNTTGFQFAEQKPGSLAAHVSGLIVVDQTPTSIKFISAAINPLIDGNYKPGINGMPYEEELPAQYGFAFDLSLFGTAYGAARGIFLNATHAIPEPLSPGGTFLARSLTVATLSGGIDFNLADLGVAENNAVGGHSGLNYGGEGTEQASIVNDQMTLPISVRIPYSEYSYINFTGTIHATYRPSRPHANAPADFNGDCKVDNLDYDVWKANFGKTDVSLEDGDATQDGTVDSADYILYRKYQGTIPLECQDPFASGSLKAAPTETRETRALKTELTNRIKKEALTSTTTETTVERYLIAISTMIKRYQRNRR